MRRIRVALAILAALSLAIFFGSAHNALAQANAPTSYQNVYLWVNPEYDDPRLLVMLQGEIAGAKAPAEVSFLVPHSAQMYSAGSIDAQGKYTGGPPDRKPSAVPGWDEISYQVTSDTFHVEYYDDIIKGQPDKTISYDFRTLIPVSDLTVIVQQPLSSSNFTVSPAGGSPMVDSEGFSAQLYHFDNVTDQAALHFEISYAKSDPRPSLQIKAASNAQGKRGASAVILIGLIAVAGVLAGGSVYFVARTRSRKAAARSPGTTGTPAAPARGRRVSSSLRFCPQCGQQLEHPERFCPHCGASLE